MIRFSRILFLLILISGNQLSSAMTLGWFSSLKNEHNLSIIKEMGIGTVISYISDSNDEDIGLFIEQINRQKINAIVEIPRNLILEGEETKFEDFIKKFKGTDRVIGWYLFDEPEGKISNSDLSIFYKKAKELTPAKDVFISIGYSRIAYAIKFTNNCDSIIINDYPCLDGLPELNETFFETYLQNIKIYKFLLKNDFYISIQAYGNNKHGNPQFGRRNPTKYELSKMISVAQNLDVKGVFFWTFYRTDEKWLNQVFKPVIANFFIGNKKMKGNYGY